MYPLPYEENVWLSKKVNLGPIRRVGNDFNCIRVLSNVSLDEKVFYFTETLLNIIHNFVPHERIVFDDRDQPWINSNIKSLIYKKNPDYKS